MGQSQSERIEELRKRPVTVNGVNEEELGIIRAALNLYSTRKLEKETDRPGMGWGRAAKIADELETRLL